MNSNFPKKIPRVCYEIFVRSFCDSNGDGIGDLGGIISKLDYLADLGIEALWLTPINPAPSYHKYDPVDHFSIEPEFGTMADFKLLLDEAHRRGMLIFMDLIVNHTSTYHPWFVQASQGPHNPFRDFYWWFSPEKIDALGIAERQTSEDSDEVYPWHEIPGDPEKYYGLFFKGMPDLNYHSAELRQELEKIISFWLSEIGVDGFRLDAARHIFPVWEKEKNHDFWKFFNQVTRESKPDAFLVGEVWDETEEVAPYFESLNATFHFDLSFALQRILTQEKDERLVEQLLVSYAEFALYNPEFIDATMLTNHDQERIGSVVANNIDKKKLAAALLLTLPGQPYIYYGEEIGMLGSKPDPYIREPFLWSENNLTKADWIEARYSTREYVRPLSEQQNDPESIYNFYKELIWLRKSEPALGQVLYPNLQEVESLDTEIIAYVRTHPESPLLVIHNVGPNQKNINLPESIKNFRQIRFPSQKAHTEFSEKIELPPYSSFILSE